MLTTNCIPGRRAASGLTSAARSLLICTCLACCASDSQRPGTDRSQPVGAVSEAQLQIAPRLALLIGNSSYAEWQELPTTRANVTDMAALAERAHFKLIGGGPQFDVDGARMSELIGTLEAEIRHTPNAVVLVYFSGHGTAEDGHNLLVPVDAPDPHGTGRLAAGTSVAQLAAALSGSGAGLTIMLLDACRDSPTNVIGFADEPAPSRTFIEFGSYFGTPSIIHLGARHSVFTESLLEAFKLPWASLEELHSITAVLVSSATDSAQVPVYRSDAQILRIPLHLTLNGAEPILSGAVGRSSTRQTESEGEAAARRCAAVGNMGLALQRAPIHRHGTAALSVVIEDAAATPEQALEICRTAIKSGARDPAVLRAAAFSVITANGYHISPGPTEAEITTSVGWLYQAAEAGDPIAEGYVAWVESGSLGGDRDSVNLPRSRQRILHSVETGRSPFGSLVAMTLIYGWKIKGDDPFFGLQGDPAKGFEILVKSAEHRDPMAVGLLFTYLLDQKRRTVNSSDSKFSSALRSVDVRGLLRAAVRRGPEYETLMALSVANLSVPQTLEAFALSDSLLGVTGPPDLPEFVRLATVTEPWFSQYETWAHVSVSPSFVAGCALLGGLHWDKPVDSIPRNDVLGTRFLSIAAGMGDETAKEALSRLKTSSRTPCSIDGNELSKRLAAPS